MKKEPSLSEKVLLGRVLRCVGDEFRTVLEITESYNRHYPPSFWKGMFGAKITEQHIERELKKLADKLFVLKEVTRFTDRPLKTDIVVYRLSDFGRQELNKRNKKTH